MPLTRHAYEISTNNGVGLELGKKEENWPAARPNRPCWLWRTFL